MAAISARDCAARVQPLYELEIMLTQSSKRVQAMTAVDANDLEAASVFGEAGMVLLGLFFPCADILRLVCDDNGIAQWQRHLRRARGLSAAGDRAKRGVKRSLLTKGLG